MILEVAFEEPIDLAYAILKWEKKTQVDIAYIKGQQSVLQLCISFWKFNKNIDV